MRTSQGLYQIRLLDLVFNSLTTIWVGKSSGDNKKLLGRNKKLPLRGFPTVGIVWKVPSTQTQLPPQTSSPWWCRLPLLRRNICGSARSGVGNLFRRGWPRAPRLPIPVFRNLFFGSKKLFLTGFLRISFFPAFSGGIFHRNVVLERL